MLELTATNRSIRVYDLDLPHIKAIDLAATFKPVTDMLANNNALAVQLVALHQKQIAQISDSIARMQDAAVSDLQQAVARLSESLIFNIELPSNYLPQPRAVIDSEVVSKEPVTSPIDLGTFEQTNFKSHFLIKPDGRIFYKGKALKKLKTTSKQGKLLVLLLESENNIVTHEDARKILRPGDLYKGLHDLKYGLIRSLRREGIEVSVITRWGEAYCLVDVE